MKTGLFFGSFNPVHIAHMALGNYMLEYTEVEEIWFVISPHNPFKARDTLLNQFQRLEMVKMSIDDHPKMKAIDVEFNLPQPSYTIDTLNYLSENYKDKQFYIIMGADGVNYIHRWKDADIIIKNYKRLVYPRPFVKIEKEENMENAELVAAPLIEISSSFIRDSIKIGKDMKFYLPNRVYEYIKNMGFYRN
ncbi:nicotinate (nicotinamide) nucleotide adenylyltransferase [Bacteroidota bacterium]